MDLRVISDLRPDRDVPQNSRAKATEKSVGRRAEQADESRERNEEREQAVQPRSDEFKGRLIDEEA